MINDEPQNQDVLMKKTVFALVAGLVLLAGCKTHIGLRVLKPAQMNIGPVKKIAIMEKALLNQD